MYKLLIYSHEGKLPLMMLPTTSNRQTALGLGETMQSILKPGHVVEIATEDGELVGRIDAQHTLFDADGQSVDYAGFIEL